MGVFTPCGSTEKWWVSGKPEKVWAFIERSPEYSGEIYVHWRGERSPVGTYGHFGAYPREFNSIGICIFCLCPAEGPGPRSTSNDTPGKGE